MAEKRKGKGSFRVHMIDKPERELQPLQALTDENVTFTFGESPPDPADYQVLIGGWPSREFVEGASSLEAVIIPWAGVSTSTREMMKEFPHISVHNLHHNAAATAELALGLALAVAKRVIPLDKALRGHDWRPRYQPENAMILKGKRALVVGFGKIGQNVGKGLLALGLEVRGIKKTPSTSHTGEVELFPPEKIPDILPKTDLLLLTVPLTEETRGLIGEKELSSLPEEAILVNISRGPVLDQEALYRALKSGDLYGAGLDVWYNYPREEEERKNTPPADFPFHELDNVVMSPHRGGFAKSTERLQVEHLAHLINAAVRGDEIPNRVDLDRGY